MPFNMTNLTISHSTSTKSLTANHALLATFHDLLQDDSPRFHTIKNSSTKQHQAIGKPSTTADPSTFSHFLHITQPKLQTLGEKIGRETSIAYKPSFSKMYPRTSGVPFWSHLMRNSPRSMCCIRSVTERQSRLVTAACQTSNKTSMATTNPFYTIRSSPQDLATVEQKLSALWAEIVSKNRLLTRRPSRQPNGKLF